MTEFLARAMPKSMTFTLPSGWTMMFCGLMSRWMMSWLWATDSAWHTWRADFGHLALVDGAALHGWRSSGRYRARTP